MYYILSVNSCQHMLVSLTVLVSTLKCPKSFIGFLPFSCPTNFNIQKKCLRYFLDLPFSCSCVRDTELSFKTNIIFRVFIRINHNSLYGLTRTQNLAYDMGLEIFTRWKNYYWKWHFGVSIDLSVQNFLFFKLKYFNFMNRNGSYHSHSVKYVTSRWQICRFALYKRGLNNYTGGKWYIKWSLNTFRMFNRFCFWRKALIDCRSTKRQTKKTHPSFLFLSFVAFRRKMFLRFFFSQYFRNLRGKYTIICVN